VLLLECQPIRCLINRQRPLTQAWRSIAALIHSIPHTSVPIGWGQHSCGKCDRCAYRARNLIERFFNRIKHYRRIATRCDKPVCSYMAFVRIVWACQVLQQVKAFLRPMIAEMIRMLCSVGAGRKLTRVFNLSASF